MIMEDKVIEIFYMTDEYSRKFSKVRKKYSLEDERNDGKRRRNKSNRMSDADIIVILILFHTTNEQKRNSAVASGKYPVAATPSSSVTAPSALSTAVPTIPAANLP